MEDFGEVTVRATHDFHEESASIPILDSSASVEVLDIPFHRDSVQSVQVDGEPYVVFRPLVEALGLAYSRQLQKLKGKSWASMSLIDTQLPSDTQRREHTVINLKTLTMWLATIDENRVNETSRPLVVAYQNEVAEAIESYFTKGTATNPRVVESKPQDFSEVISESRQQRELIKAAEGLVDPDHLRAKATVVLARGLGEAPQLDPVSRPPQWPPTWTMMLSTVRSATPGLQTSGPTSSTPPPGAGQYSTPITWNRSQN